MMGIEVENHIWVGVFSAAFERGHNEQIGHHASHHASFWKLTDNITRDAQTMADVAVESYRRTNKLGGWADDPASAPTVPASLDAAKGE